MLDKKTDRPKPVIPSDGLFFRNFCTAKLVQYGELLVSKGRGEGNLLPPVDINRKKLDSDFDFFVLRSLYSIRIFIYFRLFEV